MGESDLELYGIVGRMFREIRENKGLSLETGAEYLNIAPKSLQRYECGERKIKMGTIKDLCKFYHINYDDFIVEAKLRFGKSLYDPPKKEEHIPQILEYYNQLNDIGQHKATEQVKDLTYISQYRAGSGPLLNAAHEIPGASEEDKKHDDDIMDDENF